MYICNATEEGSNQNKCAICFHYDYHICIYMQIHFFHLLFILFGWKFEEGYKNLVTKYHTKTQNS